MDYQHVQWGWFAPPTAILFAVVLVPMVAGRDEVGTALIGGIVLFMAVILAVVVWFSRLATIVVAGTLEVTFGLWGRGWPRREFDLAEVTVVGEAASPWWYGFGVRKVPNGTMYNIWGLRAVDVALPDGKVFRIGTDDPEGLLAAISLSRSR